MEYWEKCKDNILKGNDKREIPLSD